MDTLVFIFLLGTDEYHPKSDLYSEP